MNFWKIMSENFSDSKFNMGIVIAAVLALMFLILSFIFAKIISKHFDTSNGSELKKPIYYLLDVFYTIFITIVSLFPLLGMLGTVASLIGLGETFQKDAGADIEAIKPRFFLALTSTAWGIIFSLIFKLINACIQPFIENQIEKAKKSLDI